MSNYQKYCTIRDEKGVKDAHVAKGTGIGKSTFADWKSGRSAPKNDKLRKIAKFLGVRIEDLMDESTENEYGYHSCPDCGFYYRDDNGIELEEHKKEHQLYEQAVKKYGKLYCNTVISEDIKTENWRIRVNKNNDLKTRCDAELEVLRCLFSRSVSSVNFDLRHPLFEEYIAMMLNNSKYRNLLGEDISQELIKIYGTKPGIENGQSYYCILPDSYIEQTSENLPKIIEYYNLLNETGKFEATNRVEEMTHVEKFTKPDGGAEVIPINDDDADLNAAHGRKGVTKKQKAISQSVMENDDEWK